MHLVSQQDVLTFGMPAYHFLGFFLTSGLVHPCEFDESVSNFTSYNWMFSC